ncbi:MAG TPA: sodium:solute symporter [Flavobacteriaceae bacterium]|nr:sodium:solute symporter [Flavobacteriaceae bacterium]
MTPSAILITILGYFSLLMLISWRTGRDDSNEVFFIGAKTSPWYVVAFGMIGASLSGVTFISVPGWVGGSQFAYFQVVLGYLVGYWVVALVLLPVYYRQNVTSIYQYLETRFGWMSYKTGAFYFFISRVLGAAFRLFLVALVLQQFVFSALGVSFEWTVVISILLIWVYTYRGGIKTIVWTDTLQTGFMIAAVVLAIGLILKEMNWSFAALLTSESFEQYNQILVLDQWQAKSYFWKSFIGGAFITICMTGLDQDMMQKNLSCRNLKEAQKNMLSFSVVLTLVTFIFMILGALLFMYAGANHIEIPLMDGKPKTDLLFPEIALNSGLGPVLGIVFLLGLIAAAYSSADSALTALTTSFCIDFLSLNQKAEKLQKTIRKQVHIGMSVLLILVIIAYKYILSSNVIDSLLTVAGYTYGPLLGLFAFGILTTHQVKDRYVFWVSLASVVLITFIGQIDPKYFGGYVIGYELLPLNGIITFLGLWLIRKKH